VCEKIDWKGNVVARKVVNEVNRPDPFTICHKRPGATDPLVFGDDITLSTHGTEDLLTDRKSVV